MKSKLFCIALIFTFLLTGCSNSVASDTALSKTKEAISITEKYLNGNIKNDEAKEKLQEIEDSMNYASNYSDEEMEDEQKYADYYLSFDISMLNLNVGLDSPAFSDEESHYLVLDSLSSLKKRCEKYK